MNCTSGAPRAAFVRKLRDLIERRLGEIARGVAALHGASAEAQYRRNYPPTINHAAETEFAAEVAAEICGADRVIHDIAASMGGEDFSFMLNARPGAMLWLGNGRGEDGCFLHNACYDFNDEALTIGVSFSRGSPNGFLKEASAEA